MLRCGRQPYGLLPVTGLGRFSAGDATLDRIRELVVGLRDHVFRPMISAVPRVGRSTDPNGDIVDVLRTDAICDSVLMRRVMGPQYLRNLRRFLGQDLDELELLERAADASPTRSPSGSGSAASRSARWVVHQDGTRSITVPLVGDSGYLAELLAVTDPEPLARPVPDQPVPLLHALLRHALLRTYAEAAARLLAAPAFVRDPSSSTSRPTSRPRPPGRGSAASRSPAPTGPSPRRSPTAPTAGARRVPCRAAQPRRRRPGRVGAAPASAPGRHLPPAGRLGHLTRGAPPRGPALERAATAWSSAATAGSRGLRPRTPGRRRPAAARTSPARCWPPTPTRDSSTRRR